MSRTKILFALTIIMMVVAMSQGAQAPAVHNIPIQLEVDIRIDGRPLGVTIYGVRRVTTGIHTLFLEQDGIWSVTLSKEAAGKTFGEPPLFRVVAYDLKKHDLIIELYDKDLINWGRAIEQ